MAPNGNDTPEPDEIIIWDHVFSGANMFGLADNQTGKVNLFVKEDLRDRLANAANFTKTERGGQTYWVVSWKSDGAGGISNAAPDTQC